MKALNQSRSLSFQRLYDRPIIDRKSGPKKLLQDLNRWTLRLSEVQLKIPDSKYCTAGTKGAAAGTVTCGSDRCLCVKVCIYNLLLIKHQLDHKLYTTLIAW